MIGVYGWTRLPSAAGETAWPAEYAGAACGLCCRLSNAKHTPTVGGQSTSILPDICNLGVKNWATFGQLL